MSFELIPISNLGKVTTGKTPSKSQPDFYGNLYPFVSPAEVVNSENLLEAQVFLSENGAKHANLVPKDSVLVTCIGNLGRVGIAEEVLATNQQINTVTFNEELIFYKYGFYALKNLKRTLQHIAPSTTVPIIKKSLFEEQCIPVPKLETQKQIAAVLDKAEALKQKRQQALALADDYLRATFLDLFGDPITNPKGWRNEKLGNVIELLTDYHANGSYQLLKENVTLLNEPDFAYMVRTTDLEKSDFRTQVKYIDESAYNFLEKTKVYGGEIIINKIGSAGAVYLMPQLNRPVSLAMNQFMLRLKSNVSNIFIFYLLKTNGIELEIKKRVQGAVTKTITKDAVRDIPIYIPEPSLQNKFEQIVKKVETLKAKMHTSETEIDHLAKSLSQKAFRGELIQPDQLA